jgi:site-specific DNA-methyltransferase (adenine-specific)
MVCAIEDAGFVIRDSLCWIYGQGFPKSYNLGDGKGTALKPAHEPIALAWKPFKGSIKTCHEQHGTAALNIDACRLDGIPPSVPQPEIGANPDGRTYGFKNGEGRSGEMSQSTPGRWPANVLFDEESARLLDEMTGELSNSFRTSRDHQGGLLGWRAGNTEGFPDSGGASRFFYVAKPSREERDYGCDSLPQRTAAELTGRKPGSAGLQNPRAGIRAGSMDRDINARVARNVHPTVKPVELMRWLVKLVTPIDGVVLDPFMGSGTTGMACRYEHRRFIGIEREAEYIAIAERRIAAVAPLFGEASA